MGIPRCLIHRVAGVSDFILSHGATMSDKPVDVISQNGFDFRSAIKVSI